MPRPRSLTPTQLATAALAVVDREGLGALSMRTVAKELGMGTMSLYRYVSDRDQVEALVVDLVLQAVDVSMPRGSAGRRLRVLADRARAAVSAHPAVVPLLLTHRHRSPSSRRWGEAMLTVLTEAGLTGRQRAIAFRAILGYVFGALQLEYFSPLSGPGTDALAELPVGEFPILSQTAMAAKAIPAREEFRQGLDILLRGLGV
ncbi:AcrR family transcriptional regulator [Saccharomonospora amisosensis]|uniref:AcrR family transcriptional regulator n=1 Tax=Saccharomonospora amisosensis TaxID=1128677 RepID=A0A7X5UN78_9PSEU|nr:TetR/AcrR family transcriptional regulator C-terminal domain-containing protein [Saccharomonospora amisosensis]NIJ11104.1 AcrR family transcriptional regulator [Saccharomonospora amisosensis]